MNKTTLLLALASMKTNIGRTALTLLGIVIGITAVIAVLSAGQAISDLIIGEIEAFGGNAIEIEVKTPNVSQNSTENAFSMVGGSVITTLKEKDAKAILKQPNIINYYVGVMGQDAATYKSELKKSTLFGINASFIDIDQGSEIELGRFFTNEEDESLSQVAVLGYKVAEDLFGQNDPIGQSIKVGKKRFQVIGVMTERGASFTFDWDTLIYLPVKTLQKKMLGIDYVSFIFAEMEDATLGEETVEDINYIMRDQHNITDPDKDDFAAITMDQAIEMMAVIIVGIQILLILLGSISLIVGGVGIMNIMYVSVTERTYEIGLRKSVGAKQADILWQFLFEGIIITLLGGLIGIVFGILITGLISLVANAAGFNWQFSISWTGMLVAITMSAVVGLVFSLYPARKAAKLDPMVALRKE